jgi:hypothetical protein
MKKFKLFLGLLFFMAISSQAQVSVNVNFGTPPVWAPVERVETQYYYLPDVDAYYDVPAARFIYIRNGAWIRSTALPYRYRNYNLRAGNVVYLTDYRGNAPYTFHKTHVVKYPRKVKYVKTGYVKYRGEKHEFEGKERKEKGHGEGYGKGHGKKDK